MALILIESCMFTKVITFNEQIQVKGWHYKQQVMAREPQSKNPTP